VKFIEWGFRAWSTKPLLNKGQKIETAEVQLGDASSVGLVAPRNLAVTMPSGAMTGIKVKVVYDGPIKAPIAAGQHIADLVVETPSTPPQVMPLVAENAVGKAGVLRRAWASFLSFFGV